ncbi:Transcription factor dbaG-like protein [Cladobotryum mycophilum]|uniref:Transcription factor dbaG-like protein n=1 Tax=Cladobotryum mycophilum TaxID=491253 RepID=A0ABR0SV30_9HYPO
MVYQGKPSKGCQMCRSRRIKCDEQRPTCGQCQKSRRQCPGYKDEFDLVFRNETQATERRAKRASKKALAKKLNKDSSSSSDTSSPIALSPSTSPSSAVAMPPWLVSLASRSSYHARASLYSLFKTPQPTLDDRAACFFISNYVLIPQQGNTRGFLEYVIPILIVDEVALPFKYAFEACALATLGNHLPLADDISKRALQKYTQALSAVSTTLKNPGTRLQDATLAAVLLLGLFENVTAQQPGMFAWGSHIEGAIQLAESRGAEQLQSKIGITLFIAVRTQMIIHTFSTAKLPKSGLTWWAKEEAVRDKYASQCQELNLRTGDIRGKVNQLMGELPRNEETIKVMQDMVKKAQIIDRDCVTWARSLPEHFRYQTVAWEQHDTYSDYSRAEVFPGRIDAYQDLWVASIWNMMRCSRIILASIVVRCTAWICAPVDYRSTPEYAAAARICVEIIEDIIASVPYQLGWFANRKYLLQHPSLSQFACGLEDTPKSLAGYFLTWPLACVQGQDYTTELQRAWVKERLVYIGKELGLRYALMLSESTDKVNDNQLTVRAPSMLIRKDGLMSPNQPYSALSAHIPGGSASSILAKLQDALKNGMITEQQMADMVKKVKGKFGPT